MTAIENRAVENPAADAPPRARALLLPDPSNPDGRDLATVLIAVAGQPFGHRDPLRDGRPEDDLLPDPPAVDSRDLPTIDGWIVDLSLRDERVTIVTRTDVLCSVPLPSVPSGWTAAVAARGVLAVVLRFEPGMAVTDVPDRALREPSLLTALVPVCLS